MKTIASFVAILALTACHSISVTLPNGAVAKVSSFGQRTTIATLSYGTNGVTVTGYNNDQATALIEGFKAGAAAGAKAAGIP